MMDFDKRGYCAYLLVLLEEGIQNLQLELGSTDTVDVLLKGSVGLPSKWMDA